jgi:pimeloyl-ACP methyl ester carboxylesterase
VYGWPAAWGTPGDVRDDLDFDTEVLPVLAAHLFAPDGPARFEFMRLVTGVPSGPEWPFSIFYFATEGRAELERRAGGPVAQNADHTYTLAAADAAYLGALGLDGATLDGYLAHMDASRWAAPAGRWYVQRYADYTGRLRHPVLTVGTEVDALVPPSHITKYNETVAAAGSSANVVNVYTDGVGHCNFTPAQMLTAVDAMQGWIDTGVAPDPATFPADEGFIDLTPPPWPQP